jgi:sterol desaturase/sphingolipid hydroxylase (fatty acid hydroxylase superfamily)
MVSTVLQLFGGKQAWHRFYQFVLSLFSSKMTPFTFFLDFYVYPVVILFCLSLALLYTNLLHIAALTAVGLFVWTFAEYLLHRFVLHHWPYFKDQHQAHHDETHEMIGTPTIFSLLFFYVAIYLPLWVFLGSAYALPLFAGFIAGYLAFDGVHYAVHHLQGQNRVLRAWKKMHAIHHHGDANHNYGVLTDLWDRVFGTYSPVMRRESKR